MASTQEEMAAKMIQNLLKNTGKSLEEWVKISKASGLAKHGQIVKFLKTDHGMTHGFATLVAHKTLQSDARSMAETTNLVDAQYSGAKAGLRPIYDALEASIKGFGDDVEIAPKKAYVSLRRKKQFAIIQPSTKTRVDVGINIKDVKPTERLEKSGSFNTMVSRRVRVTGADQVDDELEGWLKAAYEAAG